MPLPFVDYLTGLGPKNLPIIDVFCNLIGSYQLHRLVKIEHCSVPWIYKVLLVT